jgi:hypothetical protein
MSTPLAVALSQSQQSQRSLHRRPSENSSGFPPLGSFSFSPPPKGSYEFRVRAAGFEPYAQSGLEFEGTHSLRIDAQVEVQTATQSVTVMESGLQIERPDTEIDETLGGTKITAIPLSGRRVRTPPLRVFLLGVVWAERLRCLRITIFRPGQKIRFIL